MKSKGIFVCLILAGLAACQEPASQTSQTTPPASPMPSTDWALLPFTKVDSVNPVLGPGTGSFIDPIWKEKIAWEEKDVFNPAIVVKDGKVYML